jgi:hypothetical protein
VTQTIARMYDSYEHALAAVRELQTLRLWDNDVYLVSQQGNQPAGPDLDAIVTALTKAYVARAEARIYAQGIARGGSLVVVHAPFGAAIMAIEALDAHAPVPSGVSEASDRPLVWDEAAPVSSALHMPVLLDDAATFSRFWGVPALLRRPFALFAGLPQLTSARASFSSRIGMAMLSHNAAPLSSRLGMGLLSRNPTPLSSLLGLRLLSKPKVPWLERQPTPLSSLLGLPTLTAGGPTFGSFLGMGLLSKDAAPLSSLLKMPVLRGR